ncbi:hypothetical protein D3C73_1058590 [compost metagenome]
MHATDESIKLLREQTNLIFTVDMDIRFPRARSRFGHMLAQPEQPAGQQRGGSIDKQNCKHQADRYDDSAEPDDLIGVPGNLGNGKNRNDPKPVPAVFRIQIDHNHFGRFSVDDRVIASLLAGKYLFISINFG